MRRRPSLPPTDTTTEDGDEELILVAKVRSPSSSNDSIEVEALGTRKRVPSSPIKEMPSKVLPTSEQAPSSPIKEEPSKVLPDNEQAIEFIEVESINIQERTSSRILPNGQRNEPDAEGQDQNVVVHYHENEEQDQEVHMGMAPYVEDLKDFDLMNITITIYGITGILCEEKLPKKKSTLKSSLKSPKLKESTTKATEPDDATTSTATATQTDTITSSAFPTTVAASVKRNGISSQTFMETFYPSQPMELKSVPGQTTNLSALWQLPSQALNGAVEARQDDEEEDERLPCESSFQLLRVMMKKPYSREQVLVENYVPEQVQIGVNLCRGTELMELGVATVLVTGEEEGQIMMHVPARPCANPGIRDAKLSRSKKKNKTTESSKKKKKKSTSFQGDHCIFRLDENASLYVGIQVNPQRDVDAAEEYAKLYCSEGDEVEETDSELLEAAHAMKACMVEYREMQLVKEAQQQRMLQMSSQSRDDNNPSKPKSRKGSSTSSPQNKSSSAPAGAVPTLFGLFCTLTGTGNGTGPVDTNSIVENPSNNLLRESSLPFSEIMNVKYAPDYARSFFSGVTYAHSETVTETDQNSSDEADQSTVPAE